MTKLSEFRRAGITAAAVSRLERAGDVSRIARALYQLSDADVNANHTLAAAAKLVPRGVVCLTSALAFHGLTDQMPARVWMAIGSKDWQPQIDCPPMRFVRFAAKHLAAAIRQHMIDGVSVPVYSVPKTLADVFQYRRSIGLSIAIEGLREALRQRKATPSEIARHARLVEGDAAIHDGASVRARLLNRAREREQSLNVLLTRYALERSLYRLSISEHRNRFVLKGAMLTLLRTNRQVNRS